MTFSEAISKRLLPMIEKRGLNPKQFAEIAGISQSTLSSILNNDSKDPKLSTIYKIAVGCNMTVSELLDFPEMNETLFEDE